MLPKTVKPIDEYHFCLVTVVEFVCLFVCFKSENHFGPITNLKLFDHFRFFDVSDITQINLKPSFGVDLYMLAKM